MHRWALMYAATAAAVIAGTLLAQAGETGALPAERFTQAQIASGEASFNEVRRQGLITFSTSFNRLDGYGDGPDGRPTMGGSGTFLRVNGLDAQSCLDCHAMVRAGQMPPVLGLGGAGGGNNNAIIDPTKLGMVNLGGGSNEFDGRFANPPFLFGVGGVELLALEMTAELQALKAKAIAAPGTTVELETKGVYYGSITANAAGEIDTTNVEGVMPDLVVRPFGRKGEFATVRTFDQGAMMFHFGMQPTEIVGNDIDEDGDGVVNEITRGDLSSLHVFATTLERPYSEPRRGAAQRGYKTFRKLGCVGCHMPSLNTKRRHLPLRLPQVETDPFANEYLRVDLAASAPGFQRNRAGGVTVPLFSDLKRHDMGEGLKEKFHGASDDENRMFVTARLWGVADSAPYLHDGRATTLTDAILAHGGEAQPVRERFEGLSETQQDEVLAFLRTLRTPAEPAKQLLAWMAKYDKQAKAKKKSRRQRSEHDDRRSKRRSKRRNYKHKPATWWPRLLQRCWDELG